MDSIKKAYQESLKLLKKNSTKFGILASSYSRRAQKEII